MFSVNKIAFLGGFLNDKDLSESRVGGWDGLLILPPAVLRISFNYSWLLIWDEFFFGRIGLLKISLSYDALEARSSIFRLSLLI
jgi:hypothetical protein